MITVNYPLDPCKNDVPVYESRMLDMISPRYGIVKTDDKGVKHGKRANYSQCEARIVQTKEGPLHTSDMWNMFGVSTYPIRESDQEQYLYDVVDIETGYVLCRLFKGNARSFIDMIVRDGYYFWGEESAEIATKLIDNPKKELPLKVFMREQMKIAVYCNGVKEIRTYRKYELNRD